MMAEALGFTIQRMSANEADEIRAKQAIKEGNEEADSARIERTLNADQITKDQANDRRNSEQMTKGHEYQVENYELREFYKTSTLDADLIKADKGKKQRNQITCLRLGVESGARSLSAFDANRKKVIRKLMNTLDIDLPKIMRGGSSIISKEQAQTFAEWTKIKRNKVAVGGKSTSAGQAYSQAFGDRRISVKQASRSVISVLREEMGLSVKDDGKETWKVSASQDRRFYFDMHMNGVARSMEKLTIEDEAARAGASGYYNPTTGQEILKWFDQARMDQPTATDSAWATGMAFGELIETLKEEEDLDEIFMIGEIEGRVLKNHETKPTGMTYKKTRCCA